MKRYILPVIACLLLAVVLLVPSSIEPARAETAIMKDAVLTLSAVDATPLDGTTANRTWMPSDRVTAYSVRLDKRTDAVEVHVYSNGAATANDSALINIYAYGEDGPAMRVYDACTFTLGTAVAPGSGLYADTISGTDYHVTNVTVADSGNNAIAKLQFDTIGYRNLYFEPETFTGITSAVVLVRQYGYTN